MTNTGTADAQLILPTGVSLAITDAISGTTIGTVNNVEEGGTLVPGGQPRTLVIPVTATGTFTSLGLKSATATVRYIDVNSGVMDSVVAVFPITVQSAPVLSYEAGSLDPPVATTGKVVPFNIDVSNPGANAATVRFIPGQTRFHFDNNNFSAFLSPTSIDSIVGGQTVTLNFEGKLLSSTQGTYYTTADLFYSFNGQNASMSPPITDSLMVEGAPDLAITQLQVSQPVVSATMTKPWTVSMTVKNSGSNGVKLDLAASATYISFSRAGVPATGYVWQPPTQIEGIGSDTLGVNQEGTLRFTVVETGSETGGITINGAVEGDDLGSTDRPRDDTFDGGATSVLVQAPAALVINEIRNPVSVTAGQTSPWIAKAVVENTGQAAAQLFLDSDSTDINFGIDDGNWTVGPPTRIGGGNQIAGGAVDTLQFSVTQSGTASPSRRIDAVVRGFDVNSDSAVSDTTNTSGFGTIVVQTPPALRMTSTVIPVTPATPNAPEVNTDQDFGVAVSVINDGQATANSVSFTMVNSGGSSIGTPPAPLASVPAGSTRVYTMPWTAAGAPGSDIFTARFDGAVDANSGQSNLVQFSRDDSTATATIVDPAVLSVTRVTNQPTVTRGQSTNWFVTVVVENAPGGADLILDAPQAGDVAFSIGGSPSSGYTVIPPTQFGSGDAGWTLAAGATDSLVYIIDETGNDVGTVDIDVTLGFTDGNDPAATGGAGGQ
ncbi:MAG TPA: hypothetical protein ENO14_03300, partial [Chromatiales bacterium]|nr:hypothetical protein [Chromatiales bacterium]